jgi:hypothetical protein
MTHDELLAKVDTLEARYTDYPTYLALRAVVELHKPVQGSSDIQTYNYTGCDACVEWSHDGNMNVDYPCPTIQAIEKELQ